MRLELRKYVYFCDEHVSGTRCQSAEVIEAATLGDADRIARGHGWDTEAGQLTCRRHKRCQKEAV